MESGLSELPESAYTWRMTMTFFGTEADIADVWRSLFAVAGMKVFEDHSMPDKPNRWFETWEEVTEVIGTGSGSLAAWLEPAGGEPRMERITFNTDTQRRLAATGRTALLSPATIKVNRNNEQNGCLASASISCWTEKGARQRSVFAPEFIDQVDWKQLRSAVAGIERLIKKASPAKMRSYPVMPDAFERFKGSSIDYGTGVSHVHIPQRLLFSPHRSDLRISFASGFRRTSNGFNVRKWA